jgi:hypothetical protein
MLSNVWFEVCALRALYIVNGDCDMLCCAVRMSCLRLFDLRHVLPKY